ncbi:cytochrome c peroxidase [Mesorhizobium sp. YM1C-6-2]|uniref:cytochrome-c peroxidase n=1 Tax=Mesorhizobium sp. YM1C-6-2 TaxID=1827501 RepID=UPI000EF246CB|nr:cytochrome c peroxidase [Mesorhizobium sp. YM1C-6-2]RLP24372.1 methylamine utilization protein [Mesorhizobium sp. YM1C-6-2]
MDGRTVWLAMAVLVSAAALSGCSGETFTDEEKATIALLSLASLPPLPPDPTNKYADDPAAAALGATLFFDQRMSIDGVVACGTCHLIDKQFQDDLPRGKGVGTTDRRTMPLAGVAWGPWFFWDGRRDSLWAQALTPLEEQREHGGTRAFYAHFVAENFNERYQRIFGPLPDLSSVPEQAGPFGTDAEKAAWATMTPEQQDDVNRVFSNLGKGIAAFERSIAPQETRFDRFAGAIAAGTEPSEDAALTDEEIAGLKLFIGKANCSTCHTGPRLTDDSFHNTGVPVVAGLPEDLGRETGAKEVAADPFNCLGKFSDAGPEACGELRFMVKDDPRLTRAYKPPSLRGAATRPPYMHAGQFATLEEVVDHYSRAPAAPSGQSELHPLNLSERERQQLIAFVKTLSN